MIRRVKWKWFGDPAITPTTERLQRTVHWGSISALGWAALAAVQHFDARPVWIVLLNADIVVLQLANAAPAAGQLMERKRHEVVYPYADPGDRFKVNSQG